MTPNSLDTPVPGKELSAGSTNAKTAISYDRVAPVYEILAHIYSLGRVRAAKLSQIEELRPGDRVLYVGCGAGEDVVGAVKAGCRVTCCDVAPRMLARARERIESAGHQAQFVCCDVMNYQPAGLFDAVAANFFLNVYSEDHVKRVLQHIAAMVKPQGKLMIADFFPASEGAAGLLQKINWSISVIFWRLQGLSMLHRFLDYSTMFEAVGVRTASVREFRLLPFLPIGYRSLIAIRSDRDLLESGM